MRASEWCHRQLNFFDTAVDVRVRRSDLADLDFYYGAYSSAHNVPNLTIELECSDWPARGFFASLFAKDRLRKSIAVYADSHAEPIKRWTFTDWSNEPSPLPPFAFPPLANRLAITPGAVVRSPRGRTILLTGPNYVGKTATALAICDSGGRLVSDATAVFDTRTRQALTYEAPLGFRRESLTSRISQLDAVEHRLTVSPDSGLVALMSPREVLGVPNTLGGAVDAVVALRWGEVPSVLASQRRLRLSWFSLAPTFDPHTLLPELTVSVTSPPGSTPAEVAHALLEAIDG